MRRILRMFVVLAIASPAWAAQDVAPSAAPSQEPAVSTPVPNIHSPGAPVVTTPSSSSTYQTPAPAPTATAPASAPTTTVPASAPTARYYGNYVVEAQPGTTSAAPMSNTTYTPYYYYPVRTRFGLFGRMMPTYTYSSMNAGPAYVTAGQTYYTPIQRRGLFGLFQRRYLPAYQTTVYTPTTYTVPAGTVPAGAVTTGTVPAGTTPVYTPTTYTVPTGTAPAGALPAGTAPAGTGPAVTAPARPTPAATAPAVTTPARPTPAATAPAVTTPARTAPARTIPPPPPPIIKPKVEGSGP